MQSTILLSMMSENSRYSRMDLNLMTTFEEKILSAALIKLQATNKIVNIVEGVSPLHRIYIKLNTLSAEKFFPDILPFELTNCQPVTKRSLQLVESNQNLENG